MALGGGRTGSERLTVVNSVGRTRWFPLLALAAGAAISIVIAACGGGGGKETTPESTAADAELTPASGPAAEAARAYLQQLASSGEHVQNALWELTSSEIKAICPRQTFDRAMDEFRVRGKTSIEAYFALAGGVPALLELAKGPDWVVVKAPQADIRLALVREEEEWKVHPDLSSTYCFNAPPLPAVVEAAGVDLTGD